LLTPTAGLPATRNSFPDVSTFSGPATGWGSGTAPGHIGICVCPDDGCQAVCCVLTLPNANPTQTTKSKGFMTILAEAEYSKTISRMEIDPEKRTSHHSVLIDRWSDWWRRRLIGPAAPNK
jgi:hypothetical protein